MDRVDAAVTAGVILPRGNDDAREDLVNRDSTRLRALVTAHFDFVGRTLRTQGVAEADVDDAAQQVFLVAARKREEILPGRERAFLFQTALRIASRWRRTRARRREEHDSIDRLDPAPGPDELSDQRRARDLLARLLDEMPDDLRSVFALYEIEQLTMSEIAEVLGVPAGTVASRLRRAREQFQGRIRELQQSRKGGGAP